MTITQLLNTREYRGNQSLLARELKVSRNTLAKYADDKDGAHHIVKKTKGNYELFTNQTNKGE